MQIIELIPTETETTRISLRTGVEIQPTLEGIVAYLDQQKPTISENPDYWNAPIFTWFEGGYILTMTVVKAKPKTRNGGVMVLEVDEETASVLLIVVTRSLRGNELFDRFKRVSLLKAGA